MSMTTVGATVEVLYDEVGLVIALDDGEYRGLIEDPAHFDFDHLVEVAGTLGLEVVSLCLPSVGLQRKEESTDWEVTYWEGSTQSLQDMTTPWEMNSGMQYWSESSMTDPTTGMMPGKLA